MASTLRRRLTGAEEKLLTKSYTANPEAYKDYLKGRFWWNKQTEEGYKQGIEYFQQAIARDPAYTLAYSGFVRLLQLPGRRFYSSEGGISESQRCRAEGLGA